MVSRGIKSARRATTYYVVRIFLLLLGYTPERSVPIVARWLGGLAYLLARKERRLAVTQLCAHTAIDHRSARARKLTRGVFNHLALSVAELCRLLRRRNSSPRVVIPESSQKALNAAIGQNCGVIFVTGHIGNWELMAIALADAGYPIHTVARKSSNRRFTRFIGQQRARFGVHGIYRDDDGSVGKLYRALKKGHILGMLIDQDTQVPGVFVPFFGARAHTPSGAAAFAVRTGTPVVVGTVKRTRTGEHRIDIEKVVLPGNETDATALLTQKLEQRIRGQMSQWVWFHRRWKTPEGTEL
jgi:Kdo2-lipid IVA lauroyltransferase/acyltransferase